MFNQSFVNYEDKFRRRMVLKLLNFVLGAFPQFWQTEMLSKFTCSNYSLRSNIFI